MSSTGSLDVDARASPAGARTGGEPAKPGRAPSPDGAGQAQGPESRHGRTWLTSTLALGVLLIGLVASALTATALYVGQRHHADQNLDRQTELVRQMVLNESARYEETLRGIAAAVNAQTDLRARDYAMITSMLSRERLLALAVVSLAVPVPQGQAAQAQRFWRARGAEGLTLQPAPGGRGEHAFVVMTRALETQGTVRGLDLSGTGPVAEAMRRASATGQPAASESYFLLIDRHLSPAQRQLSFVLVQAVRVGIGTGYTRGWLVMALRGTDFLNRTLRQLARGEIEVVLIDPAGGAPRVVATWPTSDVVRSADRRMRDVFIPVAQRTWRLEVYATDRMDGGEGAHLPLIAGGSGSAITVLLAGLVLALANSRERALAAVRRATAALEADIDHREQVEQQLRSREAELRRFAGMAAHDLKAPLAAASGHLEMLADAESLDERARSDIGRARASIGRMSRLIGDLLAYATAQQAELRCVPVDLGDLVCDIVRERESVGSRRDPLIEVGPLPRVCGDPVLLRQLLDNLIGNALKYVPAGRRPEVALRARSLGADGWRVEVADRGIGVPPEQRASIFEAFHRGSNPDSYQGTGLGLAICRSIAQRHDGDIGVMDNPGGGSIFWFTLPIHDCGDGKG